MSQVAARYQADLPEIKKNVKMVYESFRPNYDRFHEFRKFIYESSLSEDDISLLMTQGRPQLDFPVLPAYLSRLLGEFSKQEPSIEISSDDENLADAQTISVVDQHMRHIMFDSSNNHVKYEVYKDLLSGGFSTFKVRTDYANPMSFNQVFKFERVFDPTMCGFDLMARESHKGDGQFCFELFPKSKEVFQEEFPDVDISGLNFRRDFAGFNWAYLRSKTECLIVAEYYKKKMKQFQIGLMKDGNSTRVVRMDQYKRMLEQWGEFRAPPPLIGKPRPTHETIICRYRAIDDQVLEYEEMDEFNFFPLVFIDGDSVMLKTPKDGDNRQFCKPYVYHAKSAQRMKNYAGITLANEIENMVQHKFMVAKEALPKEEEFLEAYKNVQKANVLVYNSVYEDDPNMPIGNPIREIQRVPAPPEVMQGFTAVDPLMQMILGSYDASLGINDNQLSGVAVVESATQSNAAAMPYIVGFMQGLQRVAQLIVYGLPKLYVTPRTIPVRDMEGKKSYVKINQQGGMPFHYDENVLNVKVEAGPSFQVQKSKNMNQLNMAMKANPQFAQFFAEKGLKVYINNMEMEGLDELKELADQWMQEQAQIKKQMMQQQMQQANQPNPAMLKLQLDQAKLQADQEKTMVDAHLETNQQHIDMEKVKAQLIDTMSRERIERLRAHTELASHRDELALQHAEHSKDHGVKVYDTIHKHAVAWHNATKPEPKTQGVHQ